MCCILQTLYESSIAFGMRKALQTEQGKGDMEGRIGTLEADTKDFERQVRVAAVLCCAIINTCCCNSCLHQLLASAACIARQSAHKLKFGYKSTARTGTPEYCQRGITDISSDILITQVAEWKLKCEAIEKREAERREADAKKHKEEVAFLESHGERSMADQRFCSCLAAHASCVHSLGNVLCLTRTGCCDYDC